MDRKDFQLLARVRLREARVLLARRLPSGAYSLAGYVVECGLKACIAKQTQRASFPPDPAWVRSVYTHDLARLVEAAGLAAPLNTESATDRAFRVHWAIVKDWSEQSRYGRHSLAKAQDMLDAVADRQHGVLQWIERFW